VVGRVTQSVEIPGSNAKFILIVFDVSSEMTSLLTPAPELPVTTEAEFCVRSEYR
jgi:hypothetical protein